MHFKPTNDYIFERLFGEPEHASILASLLSAILGVKITEAVTFDRETLRAPRPGGKVGVLDIRARLDDDTVVNIEMQVLDEGNMPRRTLFYWARLFGGTINAGEDYSLLPKTIAINILDYQYIDLAQYHTVYHLREDTHPEHILTDAMEVHMIELGKFRRTEHKKADELAQWLTFLMNPPEKERQTLMEHNREIAKAYEVLNTLSADDITVRMYEAREKELRDYNNAMSYATKTGLARGMERGMAQGIEQGLQKGIEQGRKKMIVTTVHNMLTNDLPRDTIYRLVDATREEIDEIIANTPPTEEGIT